MTVPKAYLREMKAKEARRKQRQALESIGDPGLLRFHEIQERYGDPEDPMKLFTAQTKEAIRQHAIKAGVCEDCLAKFPDPLA